MRGKRNWILCLVIAVSLIFGRIAGKDNIMQISGKTEKFLKEKSAEKLETEVAPLAALTFDDGPSAKYTPMLLDGLKERNVKASFFLLGRNLKGNEKIVRRMQEEGHLIGNHTYHHVQLSSLSETRAREEIYKTNNIIYEITGVYPLYVRPPFGSWKKNFELSVEMLPVFWTIDTRDWKTRDVSSILEIVLAEAEDGSIILMHDEYRESVAAALELVDQLQNKGYHFVTVDQLIIS